MTWKVFFSKRKNRLIVSLILGIIGFLIVFSIINIICIMAPCPVLSFKIRGGFQSGLLFFIIAYLVQLAINLFNQEGWIKSFRLDITKSLSFPVLFIILSILRMGTGISFPMGEGDKLGLPFPFYETYYSNYYKLNIIWLVLDIIIIYVIICE